MKDFILLAWPGLSISFLAFAALMCAHFIVYLSRRSYSSLKIWSLASSVFIAFLVIIVFLNRYISGRTLGLIAIIFSVFISICLLVFFKKIGKDSTLQVSFSGLFHAFFAMFAYLLFVSLAISALFQFDNYWVLEGANHDQLYFWEGLTLFANHPIQDIQSQTFASQPFFEDSNLLRIAVFSLGGLYLNSLSDSSPVQANLLILWPAIITFFAVAIATSPGKLDSSTSTTTRKQLSVVTLLSLAAILSPAFMLNITNANQASAIFGSLLLLVAVKLHRARSPIQFVSIGFILGFSLQVYGEGIFYIAPIFLAIFVFRVPWKHLHIAVYLKASFRSLLFMGIGVLLGANVSIFSIVKSTFFVQSIEKSQEWSSYYINNNFINWLAAPIAGENLSSPNLVAKNMVYLALVAIALTLITWKRSAQKEMLITGFASFFIFVIILEVLNYEYGEHKIIEIYGLGCVLGLLLFVTNKGSNMESKGNVHLDKAASNILRLFVLAIYLVILVTTNIENYKVLHASSPYHSIGSDLLHVSKSTLPQNAQVLIDDSSDKGIKGFQFSHYLVSSILVSDKIAALPDVTDQVLRGGYYHNLIGGTAMHVLMPTDVAISRGDNSNPISKFNQSELSVSYQDRDILLGRLKQMSIVVLSGKTLKGCTVENCKFTDYLSLEIYNNSNISQQLTLQLKFSDSVFMDQEVEITKIGDFASKSQGIESFGGYIELNLSPGWNAYELRQPTYTGEVELIEISRD